MESGPPAVAFRVRALADSVIVYEVQGAGFGALSWLVGDVFEPGLIVRILGL